jgi:hypothetical protein
MTPMHIACVRCTWVISSRTAALHAPHVGRRDRSRSLWWRSRIHHSSRVWVLTTIRPRAHRNSVCLHCARRPARAGVRPATRAHEGRPSPACISATGRIPSISGGSAIGPSAPCLVSCLELQFQLLERAIIAAGPHWATLQAYASLGLLGLLFPGAHSSGSSNFAFPLLIKG